AGDQVVKLLLVAREAEEGVLLLDDLGDSAMLRTTSIDQFIPGIELLAADAVEAAIALCVDIIGRDHRFPDLLCPLAMARIGTGADEVVVGEVEGGVELLEHPRIAIDQLLGRYP